MRVLWWVALAGTVACGTPPTDDKETGTVPTDDTGETPTDPHPGCEASIVEVTPADGTDAFLQTDSITATFDGPVDPGDPYSILVLGASGTTELASDGLSMTWTGTLDSNAAYTATFRVCDDEVESAFTTAPLPIDLTTLESNTYVLPWATVVITEPTNLGLFDFGLDYILAQFFAVDAGTQTADAVGTLGWDLAGPDPVPDCDLVVPNQVVDFSGNPYFEVSGTFEFVVDATTGDTATIEDFVLTGVIDDDGASISDPRLSGMLAAEDIDLLGGGGCQSKVIQQLLVPTCVPCDSAPSGYCILIEGRAAQAQLDPDVDILGECGL